MELYLSSESSGRQTCAPLISEVAAVVLDDQGREIATFETVTGGSAAALLNFLDRYPKAELHAVHDDEERSMFQTAPWNEGRLWGESVIPAAMDVMGRLDADAPNRMGTPCATLETVANAFGIRNEVLMGSLAAARLGARLHAVVRDRRAACDVEDDEVTHMMEYGL